MNAAMSIRELRRLLHDKFPAAHADLPAPAADAAGLEKAVVTPQTLPSRCYPPTLALPKGAITEVVSGGHSRGVALMMERLLEAQLAEAVQRPVALIDGCDAFDPAGLRPPLRERLLWLRCQKPAQAFQAVDLLLRDGNLPLVLMDLQLCTPRALLAHPSSVWHRLRFLAEKSAVTLCVFTPLQVVSCARARLILEQEFDLEALWQARTELARQMRVRVDRGQAAVHLIETSTCAPTIAEPGGENHLALAR